MFPTVDPRRVYDVLRILALAWLYYVAAMWSLQFAFKETNASPVWLPSGIAFTGLLIFGFQLWPGIWLGAFLANLHISLASHFLTVPAASFVLAFLIAWGNTAEAVLGVFLLNTLIGRRLPRFRIPHILKLAGVILVAALVSASVGVTAVSLFKSFPPAEYQTMWYVWWMGDVLSILILTPLFLAARYAPLKIQSAKRFVETLAMLVVIALVNSVIFGTKPGINTPFFPTIYLSLPIMVWSTYRFGYWGTIATSFITLVCGLQGTTNGLGPFVSADPVLSMLLLQSFVGILTLTGLVLAVALNERERAEEEVRRGSLRFQGLVENSQDMIVLMDDQARVTYISPSVTKMLGYSLEEFRDYMAYVHPGDNAYVQGRLGQALAATGNIVDGQCRFRHKNGDWRWIEGTGHNLLHDPAMRAVVFNYRDITHRKEWEEDQQRSKLSLQESEQRFRSMADTAPVMIWMSGADMICTFFNQEWLDFRGQSMEEELGHGWIQGLFPDDIKRCWTQYMKSFKAHEKFTMDYRLRRADGNYRWILATGVPRFTADGHFSGFIGSCIDITERKLAEEVLKRDKESLEQLVDERSRQLVQTQQELKHASRLADIGTLAATVAHELRNPLGVIHMAAYNLKRKNQNFENDKHLINIEKKVWEGNRIIDNLLSYSRIKIPSYEQVPLNSLIEECIGVTRSKFHDHDIIIKKEYQAPAINFIEADPHQMREVFVNILNNACQAFPNKTGQVEILARAEDSNQVRVVFKDNGAGIEQEDLQKVFEPFFTRKSKGTGLGLTICNELVTLHHGKIEIASRTGEGTSVNVILPISRRHSEQEVAHH